MVGLKKQHIYVLKVTILWIIGVFLFNKYAYTGGKLISLLAFLTYFTLSLDEKLIFIITSLPMAAIFKVSPNSPSSIVLLYVTFIFEYLLLKKTVNKKSLLSIIFLTFLQFITVIIFNSHLVSIISFLLNLLFSFIAFDYLEKSIDKEKIFRLCVILFSVVMIINISFASVYPKVAYLISYKKQLALESAGRFAALNGDPNYFSQLVAVNICLILSVIFNKRLSSHQKFLWWSVFLFLTINGLRSGSKSYVLVVFAILIITSFLLIKQSKNKKTVIFTVAFIIVTLLFFGGLLIFKVIIPLFLERAQDNTNILSNRDKIWHSYFESLSKQPLIWFIGTGIMNGGNILANGSAAHNVYIELFAETGFLGVSAIGLTLSKIFVKFKQLFSNLNLLFVWALLITSLGLSLSSNDAMFVLLPLVALERNKSCYLN